MIQLILALALIGFILYAINTYVPMEPKIKQLMNLVVLFGAVIWLLNMFGVVDRYDYPLPRVHVEHR